MTAQKMKLKSINSRQTENMGHIAHPKSYIFLIHIKVPNTLTPRPHFTKELAPNRAQLSIIRLHTA